MYAIPKFVEHALAFLEREENIVTLGLFRVAGKKPEIESLRTAYDEGGGVDMLANEIHPHVVACTLKLFLRSLPETLLTAHLYPRFLEAAQGPPPECFLFLLNLPYNYLNLVKQRAPRWSK